MAERFLSSDTPEALDDDVRDVLGELDKMIEGLKSAVVPDAGPSIAEMFDCADFSVRRYGST